MRRMFLAGALGLAGVAIAQPAPAYEAPWCAVHSFGRNGAYWDCRYRTLKECVPYVVAGNRGFCNPNPAYTGPVPGHKVRVYHRHYRRT
jgi:hypothetical protein